MVSKDKFERNEAKQVLEDYKSQSSPTWTKKMEILQQCFQLLKGVNYKGRKKLYKYVLKK